MKCTSENASVRRQKMRRNMDNINTGLYPDRRLETGAAILAATEVNDVKPIRRRVEAFAATNCAYAATQKELESALAQLEDQQSAVAERNSALDAAAEALAAALAVEGQPRSNPFQAYGGAAPFAVKKLKSGQKAKAIHALVASVQGQSKLSVATRRAAEDAEAAARALEKELAPLYTFQAGLKLARAQRTAAATAWDSMLAALVKARLN